MRLCVYQHREVQVLSGHSVLQPVTESNCVAVRPGGEQLEVNDQSETQVNSIRPETVASLPKSGEVQTREGSQCSFQGRPGELMGNVKGGDNLS